MTTTLVSPKEASVPVGSSLSMFDPIYLGIDEFGQAVTLDMVYRNLLAGGEPGGGKSGLLNNICAHGAMSADCRLVLFDGKLVELGMWSDVADEFVGPDIKHALSVLRRIQQVMNNRYTWLRDSAWTLDVLMRLGQHDEAMAFWDWMSEVSRADRGSLRIAYRVDGTHVGGEETLAHLAGYRGSQPVRVGNDAATQTQLDVFGEVVEGLFVCSELMEEMRPLSPAHRALVHLLASEAARRWTEPGQGLWEARSGPQRHLTSLLYCWVAIDRALRIAARDGWMAPAGWATTRDEIRRTIQEKCWDENQGSFTQAIGSRRLDAGALLLPLVGFLPAADPRMRSTVAALTRTLCDDGLLRRYDGEDGLPGREGAFTACSFWLAANHAMAGEVEKACALFERVAARANDVGLLSEELDAPTGELLGNFPQAFTHLTLIRAAAEIAAATERTPQGAGHRGGEG